MAQASSLVSILQGTSESTTPKASLTMDARAIFTPRTEGPPSVRRCGSSASIQFCRESFHDFIHHPSTSKIAFSKFSASGFYICLRDTHGYKQFAMPTSLLFLPRAIHLSPLWGGIAQVQSIVFHAMDSAGKEMRRLEFPSSDDFMVWGLNYSPAQKKHYAGERSASGE
ncbi:MAG: hypothetical protein U5K72_09165 [Balneolaceae bacterium]|nr:hypothetical protein [Balneolaceae bacterium]